VTVESKIISLWRKEMLKEFREFALRGNVIDLAIGVIIGAAFGKIITSFVNDILMPPIGLFVAKVDFTNLFIDLTGHVYKSLAEAKEAGAATLNYGVFISTVIDFIIVALVIFLFIRLINRLHKPTPAPAAAPTTKPCPYCATDIPLKATRCPNCTSEIRN
jgi:large conductance mechanosensitive channel